MPAVVAGSGEREDTCGLTAAGLRSGPGSAVMLEFGEYGVSWIARREPCLRGWRGHLPLTAFAWLLMSGGSSPADAREAAALVLATEEFVLTVEGDRHVGAAGVLHRQGGRAAVSVPSAWLLAFQSSSVT